MRKPAIYASSYLRQVLEALSTCAVGSGALRGDMDQTVGPDMALLVDAPTEAMG